MTTTPTHRRAADDSTPGVEPSGNPLGPRVWPASARHLSDGDLSVGGVRLVDLAAEHSTPVGVLDLGEFRARCEVYRQAFANAEIAYAGKALLTRTVVAIVAEQGLALDVCSEGELALAVSAGFPAERIILHGNAKSRTLLSLATTLRVGRIVVDSLDEIEMLARIAHRNPPQRVLVRVTPGVDAGSHRAITTGTEDQKFGLSIRTGAAAAAMRRILALPTLRLIGLHCHIGSQITVVEPYVAAVGRTTNLLAAVRDEHGVILEQLNIGGGHAIAYTPTGAAMSIDRLAAAVSDALEQSCAQHGLRVPRLTVEPGRAIAGPSGVTLYTVLNVKRSGTRTWVAVDGGMSDNPRPALYGAHYTARLVGRVSSAAAKPVTVVGRHCEAGDILIDSVLLPDDLHVGDLLAVPATGAYHHAMASNYNHTPRPPLIGVDDGHSRILVRRETFADLVSRDLG
ncbi:diaminopimelate decarboxylase [uncultured Jatrophihabitans sp.]|uniref:diaminopimelate decarboxylase n=1 Tax=uncultured Jatrophihabitans sp. TaxID=1610747 RepID=UPI0035CB2F74